MASVSVNVSGVSAKAALPNPVEEHGGAITENAFAEAPLASESSQPFQISVSTEGAVSVSGVEATGQTAPLVFNESVDLTGLAATAAVGTATASLPDVVAVSGVSATGVVGGNVAEFGGSLFGGLSFAEEPFAGVAEDANSTIDVTTGVNASVTGVEGTGAIGSVAINAAANVPVTGVSATGEVDSVSVIGEANISPTGIAATGTPGAVTVVEGTGANVAINSPRLQGRVGIVTPNAEITVLVAGVSGTGQTSGASVVSWNEIIVNQDPNWVEIAA
tara:strand:+ start:521 stop:1348 length:828 start_codon:yes stop_codon:yes gene_type:complete